MADLIALIGDREIGRVRSMRGQLEFIYAEDWLGATRWHFPLSLSMPLTTANHGNRVVTSYLSNLLPDNTDILRGWRARFGIRSVSPFALLQHVGEDCAGAVQFVRPDRLEALRANREEEPQWLSEREIGTRLRELAVDRAAWRRERDQGQFSLSGAQPKTALLRRANRWGIPSGRTPTTHILKPPSAQLPGHAENEHFCLTLARRVGLTTAISEVKTFDGAVAIVVERFDRLAADGRILRLHAEDFCQALGIRPEQKYEFEGGPGAAAVAELLSANSAAREVDLRAFADAMIFNWLIAGTDAHAKNYSVLIGALQRVRLAPLYDVASALGYPETDVDRVKLAMRIGKYYRLEQIQVRHWREAARHLKLDVDYVLERIEALAHALPDAIADTAAQVRADGLTHPILRRLRDELRRRALECHEMVAAN